MPSSTMRSISAIGIRRQRPILKVRILPAAAKSYILERPTPSDLAASARVTARGVREFSSMSASVRRLVCIIKTMARYTLDQ